MKTIPGMHEFIKSVDIVIILELLPTLLNSIVPEVDHQLYSLLLSKRGFRILILSEIAESQFEVPRALKLSLVAVMIIQGNTIPNKTEVIKLKKKRKIKNEPEVLIYEQALKVEQD